MDDVPPPALWSTVAALPDYLLLAQTRQLARHEQALQILVLDHLREIEARRLHLTRGYGSLFDYVVHELGYTAAAAWRRIKAMRLCDQTSGARELLQDGSLNLSNAAQLQNLFERSDRSRGRPSGRGGTGGSLGEAPRSDSAPGEPAPSEPMCADESDPEPVARPVLDAAAREELVKQAAGKSTREVQQMLAEVDPELAQPSDRMRALGSGRWELKAAIYAECRHGLEKLLMLLSHRDPHLTLGGLIARLVRDGLDRYDPTGPPRTGGSGAVNGTRSESKPARRGAEAMQRNAARAKGDAVEQRSEIERDVTSLAADRDATPRPSAPKRGTGAERSGAEAATGRDGDHQVTSEVKRHSRAGSGSTISGAVPGIARSTNSAAKPSAAGQCSASPVAIPNSSRHAASSAKRHSQVELGRVSRAVAGAGDSQATSGVKRHPRDDSGSTISGAVWGIARRTDSPAKTSAAEQCGASPASTPNSGGHARSAAKRGGQEEDTHFREAERPCDAAASAPGRRRRAEHACGQPTAMRGSAGRAASPAKRQRRPGGDGQGAGVGGVLDGATRPAGPWFEADRRDGSRAPVRGDRRFPTSPAKRLACAAGLGATAQGECSPALERHLAALNCLRALPESRSRYIPAAVRREVWRRDQGCCSYVDPHSGRRCSSRYRLEIDHIVPFALGGASEVLNLRLHCRAHHRLRHAQPRPPASIAD